MFGILKPERELLTPDERQRHASAYCNLCGLIGAQYGLKSRAAVVHDIATLWWLMDRGEQHYELLPVVNCLRGGVRKLRSEGLNELQRLLSAISVFTLGTKIDDDIEDHGS